jgi:hypothetical protein
VTELIAGASADEDGRADRRPQRENDHPLDLPGEKARIVLIKEVARLVRARSRTTGDTVRLAALMIVVTICLCAVLWMMAHCTAHMVFAAF